MPRWNHLTSCNWLNMKAKFSFRRGKFVRLKFFYIFYFVLCFSYHSIPLVLGNAESALSQWWSGDRVWRQGQVQVWIQCLLEMDKIEKKESACNHRSMYLNDSLWTIYFYCISSISVRSLCRFSPTLCPCLNCVSSSFMFFMNYYHRSNFRNN